MSNCARWTSSRSIPNARRVSVTASAASFLLARASRISGSRCCWANVVTTSRTFQFRALFSGVQPFGCGCVLIGHNKSS